MKNIRLLFVSVCVTLFPLYLPGQGFVCYNEAALTRIGEQNGPLAGPDIWGQCLAGVRGETLVPVGTSVPHSAIDPGYLARGEFVGVASAKPGDSADVQFVAWDSRRWGTVLAGVPTEYLGRTETVRVPLRSITGNPEVPRWTRPAAVAVPEPSVILLVFAGAACLFLFRRQSRNGNSHRRILRFHEPNLNKQTSSR
jgi:hypothetical protein